MRMRSRKQRTRIGWRRRAVVAISLAAYLVTTVGIPMPVSAHKQHGVQFPCQDHACGCATAGECWDHCCCYTAEQKLAWAHEHHVAPPTHLLVEVAAARLTRCDTPAEDAPKACCAKHEHDGPGCHEHDSDARGMTLVLGFMARKCRGQADSWCLSGAVTPPPALVNWQFRWDVVEWLSLDGRPLLSHELAPPLRPPRV